MLLKFAVILIEVSPSFALGYTGSTGSLDSIKTWLEDCERSHEACRPPASVLPNRVVELSRDPGGQVVLRLVRGLGRRENYACLSHRWGPSTERCKTTTRTLGVHLNQIPSNILPKTFREAGEVALHLNLKYLWIDSLCIIQNDTEDWKVQASQMSNIYSGAYVTIAATSSSDGDNGIFHTVSTITISPVEADRSDLLSSSIRGISPAPHGAPHGILAPPVRSTFRSSHVVGFFKNVYCRRDSSTSPDMRSCWNAWITKCGMAASKSPWLGKWDFHGCNNPNDFTTQWYDLIGEYSALQLTYASDKIPALAGIARHFGTRCRNYLGCYVAGLWEKNLAQDLIWHVRLGGVSTRPETSTVPSWSWASVTGGVMQLQGLTETTTASEHLRVMGYHVELAGPDEYGPLKYAEINVRGLVVEGSWMIKPGSSSNNSIHYLPGSHNGSIRTKGYEMYPDYIFSDTEGSRRWEGEGRVFCLKTGFLISGYHVCLILRSLNEERTVFERVGLLQLAYRAYVDSWYEDGQSAETFKLL
ncbi:hypothetical protein PG984_016376 [Apiospora sp. TS-2023a]